MGHRLGGIKRSNMDDDMPEEAVSASAHAPTLFRIAILMVSTACIGKKSQNIKSEGEQKVGFLDSFSILPSYGNSLIQPSPHKRGQVLRLYYLENSNRSKVVRAS